MRKRFLSAILLLCMAFSLLPGAALAADGQSVSSSNKNRQDYTTWSSPVTSYLYENQSGGLTRVEYINGQAVIEDYDSGFHYLSGRTIAPELPVWGGFFAGEDYNFLVFGQNNPEQNNSTEVIRVVKYDKDWNRLGQASLNGANTTVPFDAGSLRCDEYGGYLYIRTCHEMYQSSDGYNHQSNLTMAVRQSDMTVTDSYYDVMNSSYGYISHSFNQFILVDEDGKLVALDHGDAYPRGVAFSKYYADAGTGKFSGDRYSAWCSAGTMLEFAGNVGQNATGASVGGLAETTDCYIFAYNYDGQGGSGDRYPYYHYMDKATGESKRVQINLPGCTTPVLAPTGLDGGYMLWNGKSGYTASDTLYYVRYGADGQPDEQPRTATGSLSDCQPIYYNGKAVWYVTDNSASVFYQLDSSGVTAIPAGGAASGSDAPETPRPTVFADVPSDAYYYDAVQWAIGKGITSGTSATTFSPNVTCNRAQILTFLWRASGSPEPAAANPFTDIKTTDYYYQAALWAAEKGLVSGSTFGANTDCKRAMTVEYLWKAAGRPAAAAQASFIDVPTGAEYAPAVAWALEKGFTSGTSATTFSPNDTVTRGQTATFLYRALGQ